MTVKKKQGTTKKKSRISCGQFRMKAYDILLRIEGESEDH